MFRIPALFVAFFAIAYGNSSPAQEQKPDRSPKNVGSVLVFGGTGWYRHPEVAAISGWLARQSKEVGMQIDVSDSPKDIMGNLDKYKVLVLNNCTEMTQIFDESQRKKIRDWYRKGTGLWHCMLH